MTESPTPLEALLRKIDDLTPEELEIVYRHVQRRRVVDDAPATDPPTNEAEAWMAKLVSDIEHFEDEIDSILQHKTEEDNP